MNIIKLPKFEESDNGFSRAVEMRIGKVKLTPTQVKIFHLMLLGYSHKQMANERNCSHSVVKWHVQKIYRKFNVESHGELLSRFGKFKVTVEWIPL
jgi:DNA-binding CsgD family transcriptional regulator